MKRLIIISCVVVWVLLVTKAVYGFEVSFTIPNTFKQGTWLTCNPECLEPDSSLGGVKIGYFGHMRIGNNKLYYVDIPVVEEVSEYARGGFSILAGRYDRSNFIYWKARIGSGHHKLAFLNLNFTFTQDELIKGGGIIVYWLDISTEIQF